MAADIIQVDPNVRSGVHSIPELDEESSRPRIVVGVVGIGHMKVGAFHRSQLSSTDLMETKMANFERKLLLVGNRKLMSVSLFCLSFF